MKHRLTTLLTGICLLFAMILLASCSSCAPSASTPAPASEATSATYPTKAPETSQNTPAPEPTRSAVEPVIPTPTAASSPQPTAEGPKPTPIAEQRILELEWPASLQLGESDLIRLALIPSKDGYVAQAEFPEHTLQTGDIPLEFTPGYALSASARLDGTGFRIEPENEQTHYLQAGQEVAYRWSVTPLSPGRQRMSIELTLIWEPLSASGEAPRSQQVYSRGLNVDVRAFLGMSRSQALGAGLLALLAGSGFSFTSLLVRRPRRTSPLRISAPDSSVQIEPPAGMTLSDEENSLLQTLFRGCQRLLIRSEFFSGYSGARTLLAVPVQSGGQTDAATIIKLNWRESVEREYENYETYVKDRLPPITARIQHAPVALSAASRKAAMRYTFIAEPGRLPVSLRLALLETPDPDLLYRLFDTFGPSWWMQRSPYVFRLGREYDRVLPVHLVLEPVKRQNNVNLYLHSDLSTLPGLAVGDVVETAAFTHAERRADGQSWTLYTRPAPGQPALRLRWNHPGLPARTHARISATRASLWQQWTGGLDRGGGIDPLPVLERILNETIEGTQSVIHGDLNLENVLIGPGGLPWLIDFSETRPGHPLFDFAHLAAQMVVHIDTVHWADNPAGYIRAWEARELALHNAVEDIASRCLFNPARRREWDAACLAVSLGALKYPNLSTPARQLLYLRAAKIAERL